MERLPHGTHRGRVLQYVMPGLAGCSVTCVGFFCTSTVILIYEIIHYEYYYTLSEVINVAIYQVANTKVPYEELIVSLVSIWYLQDA